METKGPSQFKCSSKPTELTTRTNYESIYHKGDVPTFYITILLYCPTRFSLLHPINAPKCNDTAFLPSHRIHHPTVSRVIQDALD